MKIGSLFSGAGGLDLAVEHVFDAEVAWFSEVDKAASKVLTHRWPGVPNLGDITTTDWTAVEPVDILCGGWPCQPFSLAGQRKGVEDERALWPHVARAVRLLRPRIVVLENVSAVLTAGEFQRVADDLAEAGYDLAWTCLRASDVGAPHQRERLFVVAFPSGAAVGEPARSSFTEEARTSPGNGFGDHRGERVAGNGRGSGLDLLPTPQAFDQVDHVRSPEKIAETTGGGCRNLRETVVNELLPTPNASDCSGGGMHPDSRVSADGIRHSRQLIDYVKLAAEPSRWGKYEPAIARWEHLTRPAPAPTEPNKNGNPRLSAAFSQWLMGWPDGWVTDPVIGISRNDQLRIVGNGVCPQQAHAALSWLLSVCGVAA